jgi:hypothetical protein
MVGLRKQRNTDREGEREGEREGGRERGREGERERERERGMKIAHGDDNVPAYCLGDTVGCPQLKQ